MTSGVWIAPAVANGIGAGEKKGRRHASDDESCAREKFVMTARKI